MAKDMHRSGLDAINREHAARNNDRSMGLRDGDRSGGTGRDTASVAGSMKVNDPGPKGKGAGMGGSSDAKALGSAASGKIETMSGKNVS